MKRTTLIIALTLVLLLAVAAPAFAVSGADGAGRTFGQVHADHAQAGMLGAGMNPGMHNGFAGWHLSH
ncbi:MAG: hypothetical protein EG823_05955 [Actinobacteria bacterium]|nr:hypothetical protein [Actinomycetota bacterium]